jgi:hypothetical protein
VGEEFDHVLPVKEEVIGYRHNYSLMKAPSISRRIWIVISTVAVIGGFFAYYFFVYMEARREELEAKKFRAWRSIPATSGRRMLNAPRRSKKDYGHT